MKTCEDVFLTSALIGWVVNITPRPLYPRGKSPRYPFDRRLGGPQNRSGRRGEDKNLVPTGTRTPAPSAVQPVASRYTDWAIPAPQLKVLGCDNVLPGQDYRTPQRAVMNDYGVMVRSDDQHGEIWETRRTYSKSSIRVRTRGSGVRSRCLAVWAMGRVTLLYQINESQNVRKDGTIGELIFRDFHYLGKPLSGIHLGWRQSDRN
jgi:hypothetical protein